MATIKQKKALDKIVENGGNVSKAMEAAGYSAATAKTPQKLTESDGYKKLCEDLGLTPNLIVKSLVTDIKKKPQKRVGELRLGADILKMTGRDNSIVVPIQVNIGDDRGKYAV